MLWKTLDRHCSDPSIAESFSFGFHIIDANVCSRVLSILSFLSLRPLYGPYQSLVIVKRKRVQNVWRATFLNFMMTSLSQNWLIYTHLRPQRACWFDAFLQLNWSTLSVECRWEFLRQHPSQTVPTKQPTPLRLRTKETLHFTGHALLPKNLNTMIPQLSVLHAPSPGCHNL